MNDEMREMIRVVKERYPNSRRINLKNKRQVIAVYYSIKERDKKTAEQKEQDRIRKLVEKEERNQVPGQLSFIF